MPVLQESIHPRFCAWEARCVAGLVAITPAAGDVNPRASIVIGFGAGLLCYLAVQLKSALGVIDTASHGICVPFRRFGTNRGS